MEENAYIYIKANHALNSNTPPGGQLRVDALITTACSNKFWQGVIVDGDHNFPSSHRQGKLVVLNDGIIEHARIGARVKGHNLDNGVLQDFATGGIVQSSLGKFRNNLIDVQFFPYNEPNSSFFNFTEFITNDNYRGSTSQVPLHVSLNGVKNIRLMNGKYKDLRTAGFAIASSRGIGIDAQNSNFIVSGSSIFTNLFEGVRVGNISSASGNSVVGATFSGCFTGIFSSYNHNYLFNGNTFNLQRPLNFTGPINTALKGIYMEGNTAAFMVNGNQFINTDFSGTVKLFGTDVLSVTTENISISNNYYANLNVANRANGDNTRVENELLFTGLMYECNTYEGDLENEHLVPSGAIRKLQGTLGPLGQIISSGNRYNESFGPPQIAQQFTNNGAFLQYHHIIGTSQGLLLGFYTDDKVEPVQSIPNINCGIGGESGCPTYPCPGTVISTLKSQFFQEKQQWLTKLAAFPSVTNTLVRQAEANAINTLRLSLDRKGIIILLHHALDTMDIKADSVLLWLEHLDTYDSDLQLATHYFFKGNYLQADNLFQLLPLRYSLSGELLAEFNDVVSILQTIRPSLQAQIPISSLPETVIETLESGWGGDCSTAGALVRNLLYQNGLRMYADCDESPERHTSGAQQKLDLFGIQDVWIYPNPANNYITIDRSNENLSLSIHIVDLATGRISLEQLIQPGEVSLNLDVSMLASGVYIIAFKNEAKSGQIKLVVTH